MLFQWLAGIIIAVIVSPRTWAGQNSSIHLHVWAAIFLGGAISSFPIALALTRPGTAFTRHTIAVAQMLFSGLLIHLTGGRIETHFHVFGSLAFLAFYRDWRVLVPATIVVALDHLVRGIFFPYSVYGVLTASPWRSVEHAAWVIFEDVFLVISCLSSVREMRLIAVRQSELEKTNEIIEEKVVDATAELRASEERTRLIVATAHDAFIGMDSTGVITDWNPKAEATFGWSREEALGQPLHQLIIPPKFREMHVRGLKHFLATGEGPVLNKILEVSALHRDGRELPIELMISPICIGASFIFSASLRDITERRRANEELLHAKESAEAASRAKSEFLANMSHEIRTPMNGIIGMTDLALETKLNREQREYLGMVKGSAHSLLGLINDILDFSKIEAGKLDLESIGFSLRDCIAAILKPLGVRADQKDLELVADVPADVPDHLVGDPLRLRQILINLTDNAIKFTERGEVILKVTNESLSESKSCLHFSVADTGIGIAAEKQAVIFEAFAQADGSTTRNYGGTGLGLAIASRIVQQMGGRIWLQSALGKGTTFHFTGCFGVLPAPAPNAKDLSPTKDSRVTLDGMRVLVVDDNAINRRVLEEMLRNWRMAPTAVESAEDALKALTHALKASKPFALVLLDAMMPQDDGFGLAEKIKQRPALTGATVMMLSSAGRSADVERCDELGIAGVLTKPITRSDLLNAILSALANSKSSSPSLPSPDLRATRTKDEDERRSERGLRILLAEDNAINRAVATGILQNHGHILVHAANGREAVEALTTETFDLILMDVQMPELDGFEATRRIRELEKPTGRHTYIVAMTAHAMTGDRELCLAAGMDDYISKPLRKEDVLRVVATILESSSLFSPDLRMRTRDEDDVAGPIFTREEMLEQLDGDEQLLEELVEVFQENTPQVLDSVRRAVSQRNATELEAASHKLLSSLGAFGAHYARDLALHLETQARVADFEKADERFANLEREINKIHDALGEFSGNHLEPRGHRRRSAAEV